MFFCKEDAKPSDNYKTYIFIPTVDSITKIIECVKVRPEKLDMKMEK